jgi:glycosyltransferase involved in cell wall biosynthesis
MMLAYSILAWRQKLRLDVVVCNSDVALAGVLYKVLNPESEIVLDVRTVPVESSNLRGRINELFFDVVMRCKLFDGVSVITQGMLDTLDRRYGLRERVPVAVWESGFDPEVFSTTADGIEARAKLGLESEFVLMFHGTLSPTRGLDQAVRCLRVLLDRGVTDVCLVFAGNGEAQPYLSQLARDLAVENQTMFVPPVPHTKIPQLIAAADVGIDPLPDHPWWRDQSALKVYEYLALGKPVIATDIPCHRNISEAVLLTSTNSPADLADEIVSYRLLAKEERERLSLKGQWDVRKHTWRERARTLATFIGNQILQR